jgi:4-hydroxysphinganine ceramide fatty acyl 2-hydroxylase
MAVRNISAQPGKNVTGIHHEYPKDPSRLFMPPLPGLIIISVILSILYLPMKNYAFHFMAGLVNGYLFYSFIHYSIHRFRPPKRFKRLWSHHTLHHYKYGEKAFGVSTLFWDRVFGTLPPGKPDK